MANSVIQPNHMASERIWIPSNGETSYHMHNDRPLWIFISYASGSTDFEIYRVTSAGKYLILGNDNNDIEISINNQTYYVTFRNHLSWNVKVIILS